MVVKMNLRIITKNHAADPEIGFLTKSISNPNGCAMAMPTVRELKLNLEIIISFRLTCNLKISGSEVRIKKKKLHEMYQSL